MLWRLLAPEQGLYSTFLDTAACASSDAPLLPAQRRRSSIDDALRGCGNEHHDDAETGVMCPPRSAVLYAEMTSKASRIVAADGN